MTIENQSSRQNMVNSQIYTNKVENEYVLTALQLIPREEFVPEKLRGVAYIDDNLPLGEGRFIMEPMIFARLLQIADIRKHEKVLVLPCATGYPVAVISELAKEVVGLDDNINFLTLAQNSMKKLGLTNTSFIKGELESGAERLKPFDVIFINGEVEEIPKTIFSQLNENGRVVAVRSDVGSTAPGYAILAHKTGGFISETKSFQAFVPKLKEFDKPQSFQF